VDAFRTLVLSEETKMVAALSDTVEPVKAVAATVDVSALRPKTVDTRVAELINPSVPSP
jgi:hypothetical protein